MKLLTHTLKITVVHLIIFLGPMSGLNAENSHALKGTYRAVSLKTLQKQLKTYKTFGDIPKEIKHLAGITRLTGFVKGKGDIILFGRIEKNLPPLHLDDFVVALRNAFMKYVVVEDAYHNYSYPGCSIDPDTASMARLYSVSEKFVKATTEKEQDNSVLQWNKECNSPQNVRVLGVPFDSRFSNVMVQADYAMKKIVDGNDSLAIPDFNSLTGLQARVAENNFKKGKMTSSKLSMNRFWFYPKDVKYHYEKGAVIIKSCAVQLLTEHEHVDRSGVRSGTGKPDELAEKFTEDFTSNYPAISNQRPIYHELENLFRFSALAQAIKYKRGGYSLLSYLNNNYTIQQVDVPKSLPGRSRCAEYEFTTATHWMTFKIPTCGGVSMSMKVSRKHFKKVRKKKIDRISTLVIKAKPKSDKLSWDFTL